MPPANAQTTTVTRKRAPAMSVEDRREAVVAAALPLLVEHGGAVTTSQIAAAAGIAEGTVFRAFKDKRELFVACLRAAMRSEPQIAAIERIDPDQTLHERLTEAIGIASEHQRRAWTVIEAIHAANIEFDRADLAEGAGPDDDDHPEHGIHLVSRAIAGVFGADAADLRVTPELAARLLLGLMFTNHMQHERLGGGMAELPELIDLFLHGTLRTPDGGSTDD